MTCIILIRFNCVR